MSGVRSFIAFVRIQKYTKYIEMTFESDPFLELFKGLLVKRQSLRS